jgi:hypothetical protein
MHTDRKQCSEHSFSESHFTPDGRSSATTSSSATVAGASAEKQEIVEDTVLALFTREYYECLHSILRVERPATPPGVRSPSLRLYIIRRKYILFLLRLWLSYN